MRGKSWLMSIIVCMAFALTICARADEPTTAPSMYVEVFRAGDNVKIAGNLISHDEVGIEVQTKDEVLLLAWEELTPQSAYTVKSRLIDKTKATDWLELGRWAWDHRLKKQATTALQKARQLDRELVDDVDQILRSEPGAQEAEGDAEPETNAEESSVVATKDEEPEELVLYKEPTPKDLELAAERAAKLKEDAQEIANVELVKLETTHFIIYTDWEEAEYEWMKQQCEMAYRVVAKQFRMSASDNVFVGKLPIIMFDNRDDFETFASQHDDVPVGAAAGYYAPRSRGMGHMVMWRPNLRVSGEVGRKDAEKIWARILVHEFTHAYIARYKSNARVPRWLNEGMADYTAQGILPSGG